MSAELRELRHSSSLGNRASSSPRKNPQQQQQRDDDNSPLLSDSDDVADGSGHARSSRDHRPPFFLWSYLFPEDSRGSSSPSKLSLFLIIFLVVAGFVSVSSLIRRLVCYILINFSDLLSFFSIFVVLVVGIFCFYFNSLPIW